MAFLFQPFVQLSAVLCKDANLVFVLRLRLGPLPLHVAFLIFVAPFFWLEFYLCCLSRIVHFFLSLSSSFSHFKNKKTCRKRVVQNGELSKCTEILEVHRNSALLTVFQCTTCTEILITVHFGALVHRTSALRCTNAPSPVQCTVKRLGMAVLDMPFRQSKIPSFCTVRTKNQVNGSQKKQYSLVTVHLEKTFSCVTTSKQYPARRILQQAFVSVFAMLDNGKSAFSC